MLQACRILSPLRICVRELPRSMNMRPPNSITQTFSTLDFTHYQKAETLPTDEASIKSRKKKKPSSGTVALDASDFQELKAEVGRIRTNQIETLQDANLKWDDISENTSPSCLKSETVTKVRRKAFVNTCDECGASFKNIKQLQTHLVSKRCKQILGKEKNSVKNVETSSLLTELQEESVKNVETSSLLTQLEEENVKNVETSSLLTELEEENVKSVKSSPSLLTELEGQSFMDQPNETITEHMMEELAQIEREMEATQIVDESGHNETIRRIDDELEELAEEVVKPTKKKKSKSKASPDKEIPINFIEEKLPILIAQFDTMIANNKVEEAFEYFKKLHADRDSKAFVERIEIIDLLLRGFSRRCEFSKIQEIWSLMSELRIKPSENSYISAIQSFSNANPKKHVFKSIFNEILKDLTERGFSVNEASAKGVFDFDDRSQFIQSLKMFSSVTDTPIKRNYSYNNHLVSSLNDKDISKYKSPVEKLLTKSKLKELAESQINREMNRYITIPSIAADPTDTTKLFSSYRAKLEEKWRARLTKVLKKRKSEMGYVPLLGKTLNLNSFIYSVPIKNLVDILVSTAQKMAEDSENYSPASFQLAKQLGTDLETAFHHHCKTVLDTTYSQQFRTSYDKYLDWFCDGPKIGTKTARETFETATDHYQIKSEAEWPYVVRVAVGREMLSLILKEIIIQRDGRGALVVDDEKKSISSGPAFYKVFRPRKDNKDQEEIKPHPSLAEVFSINKMVDLKFSYEELPMVSPPLPWLNTSVGGYLFRSDCLVKIPPGAVSEQEERIKDLAPGTLNPVLDSLNLLGSVPWRINKDILKVAAGIFKGNDNDLICKAGLPLHRDKIPPPVLSPAIQKILEENRKPVGDELREYQDYLAKRAIHGQIKSETYSLWCNTLYQLSVASHFKDNVVWFPHNMDFRGRVYPIPPYLNHMGNDLCRSILVFAKGKPLGKSGFEWLKLHTVNLTGVKKRDSVAERMVWFEEILPEILDSANNPVTGNRWWLESDDPWQTLSACCEVRNALSHPSGPHKYVCHLPIHQDGSCNGLQHYAALGRDKLGAASVNLVPADKPQDVYSEIAAIVERKRTEDASEGNQVARACEGFVRRKVVKQTVMTTVYGVTKYGATKQIARQLKDIDEFPPHMVDQASKYLANKTFESLNEMFTSSQEIQDWFTECAKVISGDCKSNVEWVTPLGFPVVQPYSKSTLKTPLLKGNLFSFNRKKEPEKKDPKDSIKVNGMKHRNGFAPNFIHSLDSCHMMLTALHLWPQGVTYASVHDCYWTHASDVEKMNKACRDQFVALHSSPILEELSELFNHKFGGDGKDGDSVEEEEEMGKREADNREKASIDAKRRELLFSNVPSKGELDLQVVKDSVYFFS